MASTASAGMVGPQTFSVQLVAGVCSIDRQVANNAGENQIYRSSSPSTSTYYLTDSPEIDQLSWS